MCTECGCEASSLATTEDVAGDGSAAAKGTVSDFVPPEEGELTAVTVDGVAVAVATVGGELFAVDDTCTHQGCSLSDGEVEGSAVVCPCHFGRFDLRTGKVLNGPPERPVAVWKARLLNGTLELER
mgnify:CR=1 FL=1